MPVTPGRDLFDSVGLSIPAWIFWLFHATAESFYRKARQGSAKFAQGISLADTAEIQRFLVEPPCVLEPPLAALAPDGVQPVPMHRLVLGVLCGVLFGVVDVLMTVLGKHPETTNAMRSRPSPAVLQSACWRPKSAMFREESLSLVQASERWRVSAYF